MPGKISRSAPQASSQVETPSPASLDSAMPASELAKPPMYRHLDYFDSNHDGQLDVREMADGLQRMGVSPLQSYVIAFGTGVVRGSQTEGRPSLDIDIANAMKSAQVGRSGVFGDDGQVDPAKVDAFLQDVDPQNTDHITQADFDAAGKRLAASLDPNSGLVDGAKRLFIEGEFHLAWNSLLTVAGHDDPAGGPKFLTRDDLRHFFDGSLFYRLAAAHGNG